MTGAQAVVVPVIDERTAIGDVVRGLRSAGSCCVLVVDGGSVDGTAEAASAAGAVVIREARRGYGRACLTGTSWALDATLVGHNHEIVAFLDGDGSCDPADLPTLVDALVDADVALGRRLPRLVEAGAMPWHARLGNRIVAAILSVRCGRVVHDMPPFKALRRGALERLDLDDEGYGWTTQLVARALAEPTIRLREVPIRFRLRRGGTSKVSGSWKASQAAGRAMIARAWSETASRPLLGLMAKAPGPGSAKTRLASELGDGRTTEFWIACLADAAAAARIAARAVGMTPLVVIPAAKDLDSVTRIIEPGWTPVIQSRPGLAAALVDVFLSAYDRGADRAIAVAGDAPGLPPSRIRAAIDVLVRSADSSVLGPTEDGGYHLVALRWRRVPRWFPEPIRVWMRRRLARRLGRAFAFGPTAGTSALEVTRLDLVAAGWNVSTTASWPDVDTMADLRRLAASPQGDRCWAPRTMAWLARNRGWLDDTADPGEQSADMSPR